MVLSVRPAGGSTSVRPAGPLVVSRAPPLRDAGDAAADLSLSSLARVAAGAGSGPAELESLVQQALREARADLTRAIASLAEPVRALARITTPELVRGASLLRTRVLCAVLAPAHETSNLPLGDRPAGLASLMRSTRYASYARSQPPPPALADSSFRSFVLLTHADRTLLSLLYVSAQADGRDMRAVDEVARALVVLRQREQLASTPSRAGQASGLSPPAPVHPDEQELPAYRSLLPGPVAEHDSSHAVQSPWLTQLESQPPRSMSNVPGLAARAADSYRSLMPPAWPTTGTLPEPREADAALDVREDGALAPVARVATLDVAEAMGLGALVGALARKWQLAKRRTRKRGRTTDLSARGTDESGDRTEPRQLRWYRLAKRRGARRRAGA
jgi:hypothetical protein